MATKPMRGPGGRAMHATERPKNTGKTMRRTMAFILKHYKWHCLAVVICIVLTVLAQLNGTLFLQKLYDSYLSPMLESGRTSRPCCTSSSRSARSTPSACCARGAIPA